MPAEPEVRVEAAGLEALSASRSLLQSRFWAEFRGRLGWLPRAFACRSGGRDFSLLVLLRPLPLRQRLAYVPHGPEVPDPELENGRLLAALAEALRPHLAGCLFLRFDLPWALRPEGWRGRSRPPACAPPGCARRPWTCSRPTRWSWTWATRRSPCWRP